MNELARRGEQTAAGPHLFERLLNMNYVAPLARLSKPLDPLPFLNRLPALAPAEPKAFARAWLVRRYGLEPETAAVIAELAGIGIGRAAL